MASSYISQSDLRRIFRVIPNQFQTFGADSVQNRCVIIVYLKGKLPLERFWGFWIDEHLCFHLPQRFWKSHHRYQSYDHLNFFHGRRHFKFNQSQNATVMTSERGSQKLLICLNQMYMSNSSKTIQCKPMGNFPFKCTIVEIGAKMPRLPRGMLILNLSIFSYYLYFKIR